MTRNVGQWREIANALEQDGREMMARFIRMRIARRREWSIVTIAFNARGQARIEAIEALALAR